MSEIRMEALRKSISEIECAGLNPNEFEKFKHEVDYVGLYLDFLIEAGSYLCLCYGFNAHGRDYWTRDEAILGGNIVRLFKITDAILDQTVKHRRETTFILSRLHFETVVNILYLIQNDSKDLFDEYVAYSLEFETKLLDRISQTIQARDGEEIEIERRMRNSINRIFEDSGISEKRVRSKKRNSWSKRNLFERAKSVGIDQLYLGFFSSSSLIIHGNWLDIYSHHLEKVEGGFKPYSEWQMPRPQLLFGNARTSVYVVEKFIEYLEIGEGNEFFFKRISDFRKRLRRADSAHEKFLSS